MTITTTLKARDAELRRLEMNRERIVRELGKRTAETVLTADIDGVSQPIPVTLHGVLEWRDWSDREIEMLADLMTGELRRMSTIDPNGNFCDLEVAR